MYILFFLYLLAPLPNVLGSKIYVPCISGFTGVCLIFALLSKTLFFFLNMKKLKITFFSRNMFSSKYIILYLFSHFEQKSESFYYELRLQGVLYLQFKYSIYKVETVLQLDIKAKSGVYYFKTCDVVHSMKEKCMSIDIISRIAHFLKVGHHTPMSTSSINKCAN